MGDRELSSMNREEREWHLKIVEAFPRGFSVTKKKGNFCLLIPRQAWSIDAVVSGVPRIVLLDPFHSLHWRLISTWPKPDGSWTVRTDGSGWVVWRPLTDAQHEQAKAWWLSIREHVAGARVEPEPQPEAKATPGPSLIDVIQANWEDLGDVELAQGLFLEDDPSTGEVYPLREPLLVLHCDAFNTKLGLWQISEEQQVPLYPDNEAGRVNQADGQVSLNSLKGWKASWASVVDRITQSMNVSARWYVLANPDGLSLQEMFNTLAIGQSDYAVGTDGVKETLEAQSAHSEQGTRDTLGNA